jgi:hypothetical protein
MMMANNQTPIKQENTSDRILDFEMNGRHACSWDFFRAGFPVVTKEARIWRNDRMRMLANFLA